MIFIPMSFAALHDVPGIAGGTTDSSNPPPSAACPFRHALNRSAARLLFI